MTARPARFRPPALILPPPPAYLAEVPIGALTATDQNPNKGRSTAERLLRALAARGIVARPSLAEVEAERTRRGMRTGFALGEPPAARTIREALPFGGEDYVTPEEVREEARRNRARITAAFGESVTPSDLSRLRQEEQRRKTREAREAARDEAA